MSSNRTCDGCLYGDKCRSHLICRYFVPLDPAESEDDTIIQYIEDGRREYAEAFMGYWRSFEYGESEQIYKTGRDCFGEATKLSKIHF